MNSNVKHSKEVEKVATAPDPNWDIIIILINNGLQIKKTDIKRSWSSAKQQDLRTRKLSKEF
jgi:hypothetical protein